jgi:hypothetical protein
MTDSKDKNEIIDIERKGNVVRFYLGENGKQWGDDWNDAPYEHNAGRVYQEYVDKTVDVSFEFDSWVFEPSDGTTNSEYSKEDMLHRRVPCLVVVPKELVKPGDWLDSFDQALKIDGVLKFYFGDKK